MTRSACGRTSMIQKRLDKLKRDMILDNVTLKRGKPHCERGLITYPIAHVVTDVVADHDGAVAAVVL